MDAISFHSHPSQQLAATQRFPFDIRVLAREADRSEIFGLRYRAYRDVWGIDESKDDQFRDAFDDSPSTMVLAAYDHGRCVGTLRISFSRPSRGVSALPCAAYYPEIKEIRLHTGGVFVEMSRMAIDPAITNTSYRTTLYAALVRAAFMAAQAANVTMIFIATHADWVRFYEYMLGFKRIGRPALYPPGNTPITLLGGTFAVAQRRQRAQNAFFKITPYEVARMHAAIAPALAAADEGGQAIDRAAS